MDMISCKINTLRVQNFEPLIKPEKSLSIYTVVSGDFFVFSDIHWVIPKKQIILDLRLAIEYNKK
jgi:hypothetical protein